MPLKNLVNQLVPRNRRVGWLLFALIWIALVIGSGELAARAELRSLSQTVDSDLELQSLSLRLVTQRFKHIPFTSGQMDDVAVLLRNPGDQDLNKRVDLYLSSLNRRLDSEALYLMNDSGKCIAASNWNSPGSFKGDDYSFRSYYKDARSGGIGFDYAVGTTSCTPGLFYASPVKIGDGIFGVMAIKVTLNEITKIWSQATNPFFLLDRHGIVILSTKPNYLYTATRKLESGELQEMQNAGTYGRGNCATDAEFKPTPWVVRDDGQSDYQSITTNIEGKKSEFLAKKMYLPEFDWTLVATANMARVAHARWIAMTITCLSLLVMTFGALFWRQRERRLEDLRRAGAELEQRVADRTRDLADRDAFRKAGGRRPRPARPHFFPLAGRRSLSFQSGDRPHPRANCRASRRSGGCVRLWRAAREHRSCASGSIRGARRPRRCGRRALFELFCACGIASGASRQRV